jgi:hypothetical protein
VTSPDYRAAPLKAATRRMVVETSRRLVAYGALRDVVYVGLGAKEYVDFEMMFEALGVRQMVSIESSIPRERLEYNRPYHQIQVEVGTTNNCLPHISQLTEQPSIVWLDFTSTLNQDVYTDLAYLGAAVCPGSAIFVTLNAHFSDRWSDEQIRSCFGDQFDPTLRPLDYAGNKLGDRQRDAAEAVLRKAVRPRTDAPELERVLDVRYKDSSRMQVIGWFVSPAGTHPSVDCRLGELEFTPSARAGEALSIAMPELTSKEWSFLSHQLPVEQPADLRAPHEHVSMTAIKTFYESERYLQADRRRA